MIIHDDHVNECTYAKNYILANGNNREITQYTILNILYKFKFCKSVHHRTIQINHQPDATIFQFINLTFVFSSTCFGFSPAHHQELMTAVAASGFTFVSW